MGFYFVHYSALLFGQSYGKMYKKALGKALKSDAEGEKIKPVSEFM